MHRLEKFLFFYSIIIITILFISLGVFFPKPLNLISISLIIPIVFYFWIKLTSPESVSVERWSFRFILIIALLSEFGIFGYYLAQIPQSKPINVVINQTSPTPSILPASSKKDSSGSGESIINLITETTPNPILLQEFKGKAGTKLINVYITTSTSSKKIGSLDGSQTYLYLEKKDGWYSVILSGSEMGWVSASQVEEVQ
jgi:hypothetical protein